jgi:hypothetical protein
MRVSSKHGLLAVAGLATAALAGCGPATVNTGSFHGESRAVAERLSSFAHHASEGSQKKICGEDLARTLVARVAASGISCTEAIKEQLKDVEDLTLEIKSIAVHGKSASALVQSTWSGKLRPANMSLVREGREWRIAGL